MILNKQKIHSFIKNWILDYTTKNGKKTLIIPEPYNLSSEFLEKLCSELTLNIIKVKPECPLETAYDISKFSALFVLHANKNNGLILSPLTRTRIKYIRSFHKHCEDLADLFPLGDLFDSEIDQLMEKEINNKLYADLTANEVEWADRENGKNFIIVNETKPNISPFWYGYTARQKTIISRIYQIHKLTKHKKILRPICLLRHLDGVIS